jgi:tetratricopeptide (TPR) repeat protein
VASRQPAAYNSPVIASLLFLFLLFQEKPAAKPEAQKPAKPDAVKVDPTQAPTDQRPSQPGAANPDLTAAPTEREETPAPVVYTLSPRKADKELKVGNYHMKRHNWSAAVARFEEATKWDPKYAEAWLRLGQAREKVGESTKALEAYREFLELRPDPKKAREAEKAVEKLERELKQ